MGSQPQKSSRMQSNIYQYQQQRIQSQPTFQNYQQQPLQQSQAIAYNQSFAYRQSHSAQFSQQLPLPSPPQNQYSRMFTQPPAQFQNPSSRPTVIKNEVCVDDVKLVGEGNYKIQLTVHALTACKINLLVQCLEQVHPLTQMHIAFIERKQQDSFEFDKETLKKQITSNIIVSDKDLKIQKSIQGQKYWPLIIQIQGKEIQMTYYYDFEDSKLKQTKIKFQNKQMTFEVFEIYGINDTDLVGQMKQDHSDGDCIICLSEHIDTIIMPCRHMCLCGGCAKSIMDKKAELQRQRQERQQLHQQQLLAPDFNICPICRKEMQSFIKLNKVG